MSTRESRQAAQDRIDALQAQIDALKPETHDTPDADTTICFVLVRKPVTDEPEYFDRGTLSATERGVCIPAPAVRVAKCRLTEIESVHKFDAEGL